MARVRDKLIQCWVDAYEKRAYEKAARKERIALSQWIRRELLNAANRNGHQTK